MFAIFNHLSRSNDNIEDYVMKTSLWQTQFYYNYYSQKNKDKDNNVYVFLTLPGKEGPKCNSFIHITYQDIMDSVLNGVIDTLSDEDTISRIKDYKKALGINYGQDEVMAVEPYLKNIVEELHENNKTLFDHIDGHKNIKGLINFWNKSRISDVINRDIMRPAIKVIDILEQKNDVTRKDNTKYRVVGEEKEIKKAELFRWIVEKYIEKYYNNNGHIPSIEHLQVIFPPSLHGKTTSAREGSITDNHIIRQNEKNDYRNIIEDWSPKQKIRKFTFWRDFIKDKSPSDIHICQTGWDGPEMMSRLIKYVKDNQLIDDADKIQEIPMFLQE